jgi:hypothetical protein
VRDAEDGDMRVEAVEIGDERRIEEGLVGQAGRDGQRQGHHFS